MQQLSKHSGAYSCLYYPFSRCISLSSLKQLLLIFENLYFLDPVTDENWRAKLLRDLEEEIDGRFKHYRDVHGALATLIGEGVVNRVDPQAISLMNDEATTAAAVSDLLDPQWTSIASSPDRYGLPYPKIPGQDSPVWNIFPHKMPRGFIEALDGDHELRQQVLRRSGAETAWSLTYQAGSAAALNAHLAASQELGLAPVTDSPMHHELLLLKLIRNRPPTPSVSPGGGIVNRLTNEIAVSVLSTLLPKEALAEVSTEDIMRFREQTKQCRHQFVDDVAARITSLPRSPDPSELSDVARDVERTLRSELRCYQAEIANTRDRLWPKFISSVTTSLPAGGLAALGLNYIGAPGYAIIASITAAGLGIARATLDLRAERKKIERSSSPSVSYISRVLGQLP